MNTIATPEIWKKIGVLLLVLVITTSGAAGIVVAQDNPGQPHNFYGEALDEADNPAPAGTEIFALIDGDVEDSIIVEEPGQYGGDGAFDDKLTVNDGAGDEVTFTVNSPDGPEALESFDLSNADDGITELDLTFPDGAFEEEPAAFQVSIDEEASTLEAEAGKNLNVVASVDNIGGSEATQDIVATVAGSEVGSHEALTLDGGASETVTFEFEADSAYDGEAVQVASDDDSDSSTLTVSESDPGESNYEVSIDEESSVTEIQPGDNATVKAIVENTGDLSEPTELEFILDGGEFNDQVINTQTVEMGPGESQTFPFAVQLDEVGEYDATLNLVEFGSASTTISVDEDSDPAPPPAVPPAPPEPSESNIQVTKAGLSADQIGVDDTVDVTATLENLGGASGSHDVSVTADGNELTSKTVSLGAGEETSITVTQTFDEAGEYTIAVDGTTAGTLTVGTVDISVTDASLSASEVETGESVSVTGIVGNGGTIAGDATLELLIDGEVVDSQSVTVDASDNTDLTFEHAFDDEGEYDVAINDASAGTVTVSNTNDDGGDDAEDTPGFGLAVAAFALLALAVAGRLRTD